ncbi:MAG: redoxin family protein [Rhodocyclaceae bacterium]|nr:redoxin family protein [Rhodocyclaceae bacterium]
MPHLDERGSQGYREFLASPPHRAFAIAPGGAWAWQSGLPSAELAERAALEACRELAQSRCVLYAVDDEVVFDAKTWPTLWGPYATAEAAAKAPVGTRRGERFPDLVLQDEQGRSQRLSAWRGQVVVLHFWGSWCPPCRRELPDLARLVKALHKERGIRFAFVPVREPFATARAWLRAERLDLPLYAGGEKEFTLADGSRLADRRIAGKFPTTYVLDKHGLVVFSHIGDASRWEEYAPFLRDVAARSGR